MSKPVVLYSHARGPNPRKVQMVLEELKVPYEAKMMDMTELKKEPYESVAINGRVPALVDPNTGITLWESGAIIQYLVETYDKANLLSYGDKSPEKFLLNQWLQFQMSGQGPYFGQLAWFKNYHPEKVPSAEERYAKEIDRVISVLDRHLAKTGTGYLVGNKCTYADIAFVPWNNGIGFFLGADGAKAIHDKYPHFSKWHASVIARPAVDKVIKEVMASFS